MNLSIKNLFNTVRNNLKKLNNDIAESILNSYAERTLFVPDKNPDKPTPEQ